VRSPATIIPRSNKITLFHTPPPPLPTPICSYSNFFKRCFENMFIASVDHLKLIYAGSYAAPRSHSMKL
jgi:hypothetical protein